MGRFSVTERAFARLQHNAMGRAQKDTIVYKDISRELKSIWHSRTVRTFDIS